MRRSVEGGVAIQRISAVGATGQRQRQHVASIVYSTQSTSTQTTHLSSSSSASGPYSPYSSSANACTGKNNNKDKSTDMVANTNTDTSSKQKRQVSPTPMKNERDKEAGIERKREEGGVKTQPPPLGQLQGLSLEEMEAHREGSLVATASSSSSDRVEPESTRVINDIYIDDVEKELDSGEEDEEDLENADCVEVIDGLFVGNLESARSLLSTSPNPRLVGVTHVLSVCRESVFDEGEDESAGSTSSSCLTSCPNVDISSLQVHSHTRPYPSQHSSSSTNTFTHLCIPLTDNEEENLLVWLSRAVGFVSGVLENGEGKREKVLVHCMAGVSRSVSVVCAYLMARWNCSPGAALDFVRRRRPQAQPNFGFMRQLYVWAECGCPTVTTTTTSPSHATNLTGTEDGRHDIDKTLVTHPAYQAWIKRRKRDARRFVGRVEDVGEVKVKVHGVGGKGEIVIRIADDFPSDPLEAACFLGEMEVTDLIAIEPGVGALPAVPEPMNGGGHDEDRDKERDGDKKIRALVEPLVNALEPIAHAQTAKETNESNGSRVVASESASSPDMSTAPASGVSSTGNSEAPTPLFSRVSSASSVSSVSSLSSLSASVVSSPSCGPLRSMDAMPSTSTASSYQPERMQTRTRARRHTQPVDLANTDLDWLTLGGHGEPVRLRKVGVDSASGVSWLGEAVRFIKKAFEETKVDEDKTRRKGKGKKGKNANVLVYCKTESRACAAVCAWMLDEDLGKGVKDVVRVLEESLPLFSPTTSFKKLLEEYIASRGANSSANPPTSQQPTSQISIPTATDLKNIVSNFSSSEDLDFLISHHFRTYSMNAGGGEHDYHCLDHGARRSGHQVARSEKAVGKGEGGDGRCRCGMWSNEDVEAFRRAVRGIKG